MANQSDLKYGAHFSLQLLEAESILKTTTTLTLTNLRLISFDKGKGQSILPLDALSFMGYKKQVNNTLRTIGVIILLFGLLGVYNGNDSYGKHKEEQLSLAFIIVLTGVGFIAASTKNKLTFASAGGDIFVDADKLTSSSDWLQAVSQAREAVVPHKGS